MRLQNGGWATAHSPVKFLMCILIVLWTTDYVYGNHPPEITKKPTNQGVRVGGVASFFCAARGDPQPTIVWRKNGKKVSNTQSRYSVIESNGVSILRIEPVRAGRDDAPYECVAENGVADAVSAEATLTVYEADKTPNGFPEITVQRPNTRVIEIGHTAVMQCKAIGTPPPKIYWLKDSKRVDMTNPRYSLIDGGSLQINQSEEDDMGKYECVAENSVGTEHSKATSLYVKVRRVSPQFSRQPERQYEVPMGGNLTLTCVAVGSPMPNVKWRKGEVDVTAESEAPIGRNILELTNIQQSENYSCVAASTLGTIEANTFVRVQALPAAPTDVSISEVTATTVHLEWSYKGPEDLQYYVIQYKRKNANQAFSEISGISTMFYGIRALSPYTEYEFYVVAVNNFGRGPPSEPVTCTTGETERESAPKNVQVRPLSSSTMVITWEPPEMPNGQITGYKIFYTTHPNQPESSWESQMVDNSELTTISELTQHAIYTVRVQAYTTMGPGPMSNPVQVKTQQGVPSQPSNFRATDIYETSVTLAWSRPALSSDNIVHYELYWNDTYANVQHHKRIGITETHNLTGLYPDLEYPIWLAARSQRGEGASTPPIRVRTKPYVPGAPPRNVTAEATSPTTIAVSWLPPPAERSNGRIEYYKLHFVEVGQSDNEATVTTLNQTEMVIDELKKWTAYKVWVLAGTTVGDGPISYPITVRTLEDVPGEPLDVQATPLNSTSIYVSWKPPQEKDQHGIIRGYHIHLQELKEEGKGFLNEPLKFDVVDSLVYNVTGLQPDTRYSVQVAALTRKGDGDRSHSITVKTPGGVPVRPTGSLKVLARDPTISIELEWERPKQTYGELRGYRLRWGIKDQPLHEETISGAHVNTKRINDLERGVEYEFRVAGMNHIGIGQEMVKYYATPEGVPSGPPTNINVTFQTPDVVCITWEPPTRETRNGQIIRYDVMFHKKIDHGLGSERNATATKAVFTNLEENTEYFFRVRAYTKQGAGPSSEKMRIQTERDMGRAPMSVKAVATSDQTVEVWWEGVPSRGKLLGYKVFYTMTAVEDLDEWLTKTVGLTESVDLINLEKYATYAVAIAARYKSGLGRLSEKITVKVKPEEVPLNLRAQDVSTHSMTLSWDPPIRLNPTNYKISFDAIKEFVDSQGMTQTQLVPKREIVLKHHIRSHTINELSPFTTYNVNVSAIPADYSYRPPTKMTITTQMAAPQPMVKPDFYGVINQEEIQVILPQASEEYGPISHYYLIVVPEEPANTNMNPDQFLTEELLHNRHKDNPNAPYIAARFAQRNIPYTYHLGSNETNHNFTNKKLERGKKYRIFVRAVVDTPQKHLYTSSPFSEYLALDMREAPPGEPPIRPLPDTPNDPHISVNRNTAEPGIVWLIGKHVVGALAAKLQLEWLKLIN